MSSTPPTLLYAAGFSLRKRPLVRQFLNRDDVRFVRDTRRIPPGATVAVWASGPLGVGWVPAAGGADFQRIFLEDGFLRSVGLGADLIRPLSWVVDHLGIYYDASRPSELENMLQATVFSADTLRRAASMQQQLVATGLTKYNVGAGQWQRPAAAEGLELVLVPGQVETDAAIRLGAPGITTNLALLQAARRAHPAAWVIYKPHPDVVAGLRNSGAQEGDAAQWCDQIVTDVSMGALLDGVDVVHVLSSLAGFEALLRGKRVVCHGLPFYAGWGLTHDVLSTPRRTRRLSMDELVAGVLLLYPRYVSRSTRLPCTAEQALSELIDWKAHVSARTPLWRKMLRPFIRHA
ncbi:MAG: beta-3-deoxy-D-manno-oct-2-ulosonic acid transferase [Polaromonas sp.]